jgi:RNA polymerase sigma-70 factor (ECF subfamily)
MSGETFETLLAPNLQSVRRLVKSRLRAWDQADDIVQQTLLHAFASKDQLRAESKFKSWLWSIALNEVRMFLRATRPSVSLNQLPNFEFTDQTPSPLAQCEQTEREERLRAGMARLTKRDRTAIRLVDLNGLSIAEAARALATSEAAFKSTLFRARQRLGHALRRTQDPTATRLLSRGQQTNFYQLDSNRSTTPAGIAA